MDPMQQRTRLPANLDEEDPFLSLAEIKLSLRQMLTIMFSLMVWGGLCQMTITILPLSFFLAGLLWSWVILVGVFFALFKKDGRPYEEYLSQKVVFLVSERYFILKDSRAHKDSRGIDDVDWDEVDDISLWR